MQNTNMLWIEIDCSEEFNKTFSLCFWQLFENNKERNYVVYIVNMYLTYKKASLLLIQSFSKLFMWHKKTTFLLYLCWWEILYFCWNIFFCCFLQTSNTSWGNRNKQEMFQISQNRWWCRKQSFINSVPNSLKSFVQYRYWW